MKENPTSDFQRCTTLIQRQWQTLKQRRNNVDKTLFQPSADVNQNYIESNWASDDCGFANR